MANHHDFPGSIGDNVQAFALLHHLCRLRNDSEKYIVDNVHSGYHLIGGSHDAIDSNFEVHNTKGLYVCDASVFKTHVSSNTHASVVLLADIFSNFFIINNFDG